MALCEIEGLDCPTCEDKSTRGGAKKNIYIIDRTDLDEDNPYDVSANGTVTGFNFNTYGLAYKFCAMNRSVGATQTVTRGDNLVPYWLQNINGKFEQQTQDAKNVFDALAKSDDLIVVIEKNNATFEVYGLDFGMTMGATTKNLGILTGDDNKWNLVLEQVNGGEDRPAPDFLNVSYANTKALLESYTA